jgi:hypothetical protein
MNKPPADASLAHVVKLCGGADLIEDLADWQKRQVKVGAVLVRWETAQ